MAINAQKLIPSTISSVPFETVSAELGSFPRIFADYFNPQFLAFPRHQSLRVLIKPMGQPPVKSARKRSSCPRFNLFQIFNYNCFDLRKVYLFDGSTNHRFNFCLGVLLTFRQLLSSFVNSSPCSLPVTKNQSVFVVISCRDNCP